MFTVITADAFTAHGFYQPTTRLAGRAFKWQSSLYFDKELGAKLAGFGSFSDAAESVEDMSEIYMMGDVECVSAAWVFTIYCLNSGAIPAWLMSSFWPAFDGALRGCLTA